MTRTNPRDICFEQVTGGGLIKILHTADWHLGHELAGWARQGEQLRVLEEISALVLSHKVDALVVAGDVFDHQNPSSAMYKMLYEFFDRLAIKAPKLVSVIISGNHDSAGRLEAPGPLLKRANVSSIGSLHLKDGLPDLDHHLVPVKRDGEVRGYILAIPYLRPADLPVPSEPREKEATSSIAQGVRQLYQETISAVRARIGDRPLVVTGHLHVKGASLSESLSERRIVIGGEHAVPPEVFGLEADYVALGHLHRAQSLGAKTDKKNTNKKPGKKNRTRGAGCVRYAGSPLPLSVAERTYRHGVSLVTLGKSPAKIEHIELTRPVAFLRVPSKGHLPIDEITKALEALDLDSETPQEEWPFVQIALRIEGPQTGTRAKLDEICLHFPVRELAPDLIWPGRSRPRKENEPIKRLGEHNPGELFKQAFEECYGSEPDSDHLRCFQRLLEEVGT